MHCSSKCGSKPSRKPRRLGELFRVEFQQRVDVRPDQPGPHGALMVSGVARAQVAVVFRLVVGMAGGERAESDGREQALGHHVHHRLPARRVEHREIERDGKHLIRTAGVVIAAGLGVHYIVEVAARLVPEASIERLAGALGDARRCRARRRCRRFRASHDSSRRRALYQRALISTALPRRGVTTQSSDLGVHPGELIALGALAEQRRRRGPCRCRSASRSCGDR